MDLPGVLVVYETRMVKLKGNKHLPFSIYISLDNSLHKDGFVRVTVLSILLWLVSQFYA